MSLKVEELIYAYLNGFFPMADANGEISWYAPDPRAIIPLENYKPSKSLRPILNRGQFDIRVNQDFREVMNQCAKPRFENDETWISDEIINVYCQLNTLGFAHSVEAYEDNKLVGGLYGVSIGAVFFGESMFHLVSNASKVAFHYLIEILKKRGFTLLDTQFINDNVLRYGAIEIPKDSYEAKLEEAISKKMTFVPAMGALKLSEVMA